MGLRKTQQAITGTINPIYNWQSPIALLDISTRLVICTVPSASISKLVALLNLFHLSSLMETSTASALEDDSCLDLEEARVPLNQYQTSFNQSFGWVSFSLDLSFEAVTCTRNSERGGGKYQCGWLPCPYWFGINCISAWIIFFLISKQPRLNQ